MPKISQRPAQSGADVADGDLIGIIDVGSPNLDERITVAEFAQAPQFSSRYKPLASDSVVLSHAAMSVLVGSPALGVTESVGDTTLRQSCYLLDASSFEGIAGQIAIPQGWTTMNVYLWTANAGAGSGDWVWYFRGKLLADGTTTIGNDAALTNAAVATAGAQSIAKRITVLSSVAVTAGGVYKFSILRGGSEGTDTLANDMGILALELVRAS